MINASISQNGRSIEVRFEFSAADVRAIKTIPGRRWVPATRVWAVPLTLETGRELRRVFGERLVLDAELRAWGRDQIRSERRLARLAASDDATLTRVPADFAAWLDPHQRADIAFMAERDVINGNEPGLGKTEEMIGTIIEAGITKPILITAPVSTLQDVWQDKILRWIPDAVVLTGDTLAARERAVQTAAEMAARGEQFWLVLNFDFCRYRRDPKAEPVLERGKLVQPSGPRYPELHGISWGAVVVDEFRKVGLSNRNTLAHKGFSALKTDRRWLLSGTPMGGNPLNLWGALNWIAPKDFRSMWQWAERWMKSEANPFAASGKTLLPEIKDGLEAEFYQSLSPYMVRRTRAETRKNAAPVVHDVWCSPTRRQAKQYEEFARAHETRVEGSMLAADGVLAIYTRLRQIATAEISGHDPVVFNPAQSGKLNRLIDNLAERGITGKDSDGDEKVVVASQWTTVLHAVCSRLDDEGIPYLLITGEVAGAERNRALKEFRTDGGPRVMVVSTTAGGVGLDLDRADSVHILDETWDPDDTRQVEFRIDRRGRTRTAPMDILYYRTKGTIDEYVRDRNADKRLTNDDLLDLRRAAFQMLHK